MSLYFGRREYIQGYTATDQTWPRVWWMMRHLHQAEFTRCKLLRLSSHNGAITESKFVECELSTSDLDQTSIDRNTFDRCTFKEFGFTRAGEFRHNVVQNCRFENKFAHFGDLIQLNHTIFTRCTMRGVRMGRVWLVGVETHNCDFTGLKIGEVLDPKESRKAQWNLGFAGAQYCGEDTMAQFLFALGNRTRKFCYIFSRLPVSLTH